MRHDIRRAWPQYVTNSLWLLASVFRVLGCWTQANAGRFAPRWLSGLGVTLWPQWAAEGGCLVRK